jgi:hypothetical protein
MTVRVTEAEAFWHGAPARRLSQPQEIISDEVHIVSPESAILKGSTKKAGGRGAQTGEDVESFLAALDHPHKLEILALRRIILDADPGIAEGIKWNAPSFRTSEWFATFHLRAKAGVQVILHFGAKVRDKSSARAAIADPESILTWLADDRASTTFRDLPDVEARQSAFAATIREWIRHV